MTGVGNAIKAEGSMDYSDPNAIGLLLLEITWPIALMSVVS
jgi:hypothetical protein